jgi:hypothetical protein
MSSESAEIKFTNSVDSVVKELLGQEFSTRDFIKIPFWEEYSILIRKFIKEESPRYPSSFDDDWNSRALQHKIISELKIHVPKSTVRAVESVPWTVAAMIATKDESMKDLRDFQLRFLLDLAIGVTVDDFYDRYIQTQRNAAYAFSPKNQEELSKYSNQWKELSEDWKKVQDKLRQRVTPKGGIERK